MNRLLHRPGVVQGPPNLMLDRSDDLTVELPDHVGDIAPSVVEPGQVDQDGGDDHCQQYEASQCRPQPELASRSSLWRRRDRRRVCSVLQSSWPGNGITLG